MQVKLRGYANLAEESFMDTGDNYNFDVNGTQ